MRVLIIRNAYQKDTGGAEQYAYNFGRALKDAGLEPFVVTKHRAIIEKCRMQNIKTIYGVWSENQSWSKLYYVRALYTTLWYIWLILSKNIDIVHPQSRDDFVFATWAGRLLRKKVFWTDHADLKYLLDRVNHPHPRMQKWLLGCANYSKKIICVSSSEKQSINKVAPEISKKLTLIYNGVFAPTSTGSNKKPVPTIGTISRLVPEKGITEIIEAFSKLSTFKGNLWIIGSLSGNEKKYHDLAVRLNVANRVDFIGYTNDSDKYLKRMSYFVHASYHEAFSTAIIEASMNGLPIIATNVGGTPEIIENGKTGLLVEPRDSEALTRALERLIKNPPLAKSLGSNARKNALEKFDFQKIVEKQIIPLYNN